MEIVGIFAEDSLWDYWPGESSFCWVPGGDVSAGCVCYG